MKDVTDLHRLYYYITTPDKQLAALQMWGTIKDDLTRQQRQAIITAWKEYDQTDDRSVLDRAVTTVALQVK